MSPEQSFTCTFLKDELNTLYHAEQNLNKLITSFSIIAIFLASLGLFGLATFTTECRAKEMGIRKVLGASTTHILYLSSTSFIKLVLIANFLAWPVAYYLSEGWLQAFAYRVTLGIWPFILSGILVLFIALFTVCYQALKAAYANPIETLRHE